MGSPTFQLTHFKTICVAFFKPTLFQTLPSSRPRTPRCHGQCGNDQLDATRDRHVIISMATPAPFDVTSIANIGSSRVLEVRCTAPYSACVTAVVA
jgi:hypothetical protein